MENSRIPDLELAASPPRRDLEYADLEIGEVIGSGGQAVVSKVYAPPHDGEQLIAVKQPTRDAKTLPRETINRFLEEAKTWATVDAREREKPRWRDSEHIVGVIDFGDQLPWIALEYMDGGLDDRLRENPDRLPLSEALWIGECVCRGVELAHNYGIAHLDLKPANVLFRETPEEVWDVPKVADWGVARVLAEQTGTMEALSVEYAAPEQFDSDQFGDPDTLTDVYQVGALVYAMLTGDPPFTGPQTKVLHDVVYGDPPVPPSTHRPEIPPELDAAVMLALEREKTKRYENIGTFRKALAAVRIDGYLPPVVASRIKGTVHLSPEASSSLSIAVSDEANELKNRDGEDTVSTDLTPVETIGGSKRRETLTDSQTDITVIGCGSGGCGAIHHMNQDCETVEFIAADTDVQHLIEIDADGKILLGEEKTGGGGTGSLPQVGEEATREKATELQALVQDASVVIPVGGLGGGTGTGSLPIITRIARETGALTIPVVTTPFESEGQVRQANAKAGIKRLRKEANTVLVVPGRTLLSSSGDLPFSYAMADYLEKVMRTIIDAVNNPNQSGSSFENIRTQIEQGGFGMVGFSNSIGDVNPATLVDEAVQSPQFPADISDAGLVIAVITGDSQAADEDCEAIASTLRDRLSPDIKLACLTSIDKTLAKTMQLTVVATGFEYDQETVLALSFGYSPEKKRIEKIFDQAGGKLNNVIPVIHSETGWSDSTIKTLLDEMEVEGQITQTRTDGDRSAVLNNN